MPKRPPRRHRSADKAQRRTYRRGSSRRRRLLFEHLETRHLLATIQWDGGGNGTSWSDRFNWVDDTLPTAADDAVIDMPASNPAITIAGTNFVRSLLTQEAITFSGGTFTSPSVQLNAQGTIAGATIVGANFQGMGSLQITSASGTLNGVTLGVNTTLRQGTSGSGNQVTVLNGLTLANNSVLRLEVTSTGCDRNSNISEVGLNFSGGAQVLSGTGSVELFASAYVYGCGTNPGPEDRDVRVRPTGIGSSLTIGPGVTVHNVGSSDLTSLGDPSLPLIIQGTISARSSGQTLRVNGSTVTNDGTLSSTAGELDTNNLTINPSSSVIVGPGSLRLRGNWDNNSSITQSGGTIHLGDTFTLADLGINEGRFTGTAGTVSIFGTLDGTAAPNNDILTIDAVRQWQLAGGTLKNVTVNGGGDPLKPFQITAASGTLDGVTLGWSTTLREGNGSINVGNQVTVLNNLTLANNSVLRVEKTTFSGTNRLDVGLNFSGVQTLGGSGIVELYNAVSGVFGAAEESDVRVRPIGGGTLTIGGGITVRTATNSFLATLGDATGGAIVNQGTIVSQSSGQTLRVTGSTVTNDGTLSSTAGELDTNNLTINPSSSVIVGPGSLRLRGNWDNNSSITQSGGTIHLGDTFTVADLGINEGRFTGTAGTVSIIGTVDGTAAPNNDILTIDAVRQWQLAGGTLKNVTVNGGGDPLKPFQITAAGGTLNGVTLGTNTTLRGGIQGQNSNAGNQVEVLNGLVLSNSSLLRLERTDSSNGALSWNDVGLNFSGGARSLGGIGVVELFNATTINNAESNVRVRPTGNGTLTIGAGITVRNASNSTFATLGDVTGGAIVNQGTIISQSLGQTLRVTGSTVTNTGNMQVLAGSLDVNNLTGNVNLTSLSGSGTLDLDGTYVIDQPVSVVAGTTLVLRGNWDNNSSITQAGGTIHLGDTFTVADLGINEGRFTGTAGTVSIIGTLDGTAAPNNDILTIDAVRQWQLAGGTLKNVTVNGGGDPLKPFQITAASGTLNGVTLGTNTTLRGGIQGQNSNAGNQVEVLNGLVLSNSSLLRLERTDSSNGALSWNDVGLNFSGGARSLGGIGVVELFNATTINNAESNVRVRPTGNGTLTIGSGITVRNASNSTYATLGDVTGGAIVNQGTIISQSLGQTLRVTGSTVTNNGTLSSTAGELDTNNLTINPSSSVIVGPGSLRLRGNWDNNSSITQSGGTIHLGDTFTLADLGINEGRFTGSAGTVSIFGTLDGTGTPTNDTLTIDATRQWQLAVGTLKDVTVTGGGDPAKPFQITSASGTLNNVILGWNTTLREGTIGSGNQVTVLNGLTLTNNSVLRLEHSTSNGANPILDVGLNFSGTTSMLAALGAGGTVELSNATLNPAESNVRLRPIGGGTLTIGSGITVRNTTTSTLTMLGDATSGAIINQGMINSQSSGNTLRVTGISVSNQGPMSATLGTLQVSGLMGNLNQATITGNGLLDLNGTYVINQPLSVPLGTGGLTLRGNWDNESTITQAGGTISLGDTFTVADLGLTENRFTGTGGTVSIFGTLDGVGPPNEMLTLDVTRQWQLAGGTLKDVTVTGGGDPAKPFQITSASGTLNNVILGWNTTLREGTIGSGNQVTVLNGLTLTNNSVLRLEHSTSNGANPILDVGLNFSGTTSMLAALGAGGTVELSNATLNPAESNVRLRPIGGGTLTIGSGITLRNTTTSTLTMLGDATSGAIINQGTMISQSSGQTLRVTGSTVTNTGTLKATAGTLDVNNLAGNVNLTSLSGSGALDFDGIYAIDQPVSVVAGSSLILRGSWNNNSSIAQFGGTVFLGGTFTAADLGTFTGTGGTVQIFGRLEDDSPAVTTDPADTLVIDAVRTWELSGATLQGVIIDGDTPAALLNIRGFAGAANSTLDGVTLSVDTTIRTPPFGNTPSNLGNQVVVLNGLVLDGGILRLERTVSGPDSAFDVGLNFNGGAQTLGGTGIVELHNAAGSNEAHARVRSTGTGSVLTINTGITVHNSSNSTFTTLGDPSNSLVIVGTVEARSAGQTLRVTGTTVTNTGTLKSQSGILSVSPTTFTSNGTVQADGGTVNLQPTNFTNYSSGMLTGGTWRLSGGVIQFPGADIVTNAATIFVENASSRMLNSITGQDALNRLAVTTPAGSFMVRSASGFVSTGTLSNSGITSIDATSFVGVGATPTAGLTALWHAEGNAFDGFGTSSGSLVNGTTFGPGKVGRALSLDGVNDLVSTPLTPSYAGGATFAAWIKTTDSSGALITGGGGATASRGMGLFVENGAIRLLGSKATSGALNFQIVGPTINDGQFHHVAATWTGTTAANGVNLYVDGTLVGSTAALATIATDTHPIHFGGHGSIAYAAYAGLIDEIGIFNRALSAAEIQSAMGLGNFTQLGGTTIVNGTLLANHVYVQAGVFGGTGVVPTGVSNLGGTVAPGNSPGCLTINGNYDQAASATLGIEILGATACTEYDRLIVNGGVTLAGFLDVDLPSAYSPTVGTKFLILQNDGNDSINGQLKLPNTSTVLREQQVFRTSLGDLLRISYIGGDGNDLELEYLGKGLLVSNTNAAGPGSLAQAVLDANSSVSQSDLVAFAIDDAYRQPGGYLIESLAGLSVSVNAGPIIIDGTTQYDYVDKPIIEFRRNAFAPPTIGIDISAAGSEVIALSLNSWATAISISAANVDIVGNYIGIPLVGTATPNGTGVFVGAGSTGVGIGVYGDSNAVFRNVISGSTNAGIEFRGSNSIIQGNYIGVDPTGNLALPNSHGIQLISSQQTVLRSNLISGNTLNGVQIVGGNTNSILGNTIGLNAIGSAILPNQNHGVAIQNSATNNLIGGLTAPDRNVISGNGQHGVFVSSSNGNRILGNYLGLDNTGEVEFSNGQGAILLDDSDATAVGSSDGDFKGNLIVGANASQTGISVENGSTGNGIVGNHFGLSATNQPLGYLGNAIAILGSNQNLVGGATVAERNVLGQYSSHGILVGNGSESNVIVGNYVGVHPDGQSAVFSEQHATYGIAILNSSNNSVGLAVSGTRNLIGGNQFGVFVAGAGSVGNSINGNWIGLTQTGGATIPNEIGVVIAEARGTTVGGPEGNVISGNRIGIEVSAAATRDTLITGNRIGTNGAGSTTLGVALGVALGNSESGIRHVGGVRTQIRQNLIVANGPVGPLPSNPAGAVEVLAGDAILSENRIFNNFVESIRTDAFPGSITITQARLDGFALGEITGATPFTTFTVEFFEASQQNQAERYVGTNYVVTDEIGFAEFEIGGLGDLTPGKYLTATITGAATAGLSNLNTSTIADGVIPQVALIRGLPTISPEGTPINLQAFAVDSTITGYAITGYVWEVLRGSSLYATGNEAGIQFAPDDDGVYIVRLKLTLTSTTGDQQTVVLGPHAIRVTNVAPTPQFEISPNSPRVGEPVTLVSNSSDPGQSDVLKYAWTIVTGSRNGTPVFTQPSGSSPGDAQAVFTPTGGGLYFATLQVDDGDGAVRQLTRQFEVAGLAQNISVLAPITGSEGQTVRAFAPESELSRSETLLFQWRVEKRTSSGLLVDANYPVTLPSRGVVEFIPNDDGRFRILLAITDATGGGGEVAAPPVEVVVTNTSPVVSIPGRPTAVPIGVPVNVLADITEPRTIDTFTVTWSIKRNGRAESNLGQVGNSPNQFSFTPTRGGIYTVTATAIDDDFDALTGVGKGTAQQVFIVSDSELSIAIAGPIGQLEEGVSYPFTAVLPSAVLSGATSANFEWSVSDGNGRIVDSLSGTGVSVPTFQFTPPHGGRFALKLNVGFSDNRTATALLELNNVVGRSPAIDDLRVISPASNVTIIEGTPVTVRAFASDSGESIGLTYRWQLQRPGQSFQSMSGNPLNPSELDFVPTDDGTHRVRVTVIDSEGNQSQRELAIDVGNAAPIVRLDVVSNSGTDITFSAIALDPGSDDQSGLNYLWNINGEEFALPANGQVTRSITAPTKVTLRVSDDRTTTTVVYYVLVGTGGNDVVTVTSADETLARNAGADRLVYLGLDGDDRVTVASGVAIPLSIFGGRGNDTIDSSAVSVSVELDGGDGNDTLTAGDGADILRAGNGTNVLVGGNGKNRFVGGGNDTMTGGNDDDIYEVHFSTIVLRDIGGGFDTVDLTAAPAGVTLDFSQTNGVPQSVFPTSLPAAPYHGSTLSLEGSFTKLVGSTFGDALSASTQGSILEGGLGDDQLVSSGQGVVLDGGLGNDQLVLASASGTTVRAGVGNDQILGTLAEGTTTSIDAGDGDDAITIAGPSTGQKALVTIVGGTGINTLTASNIRGKVFAANGEATNLLRAFGAVEDDSTLTATITNSSDIDIFGSPTGDSEIEIIASQDVDIYGSGGDRVLLTDVLRAAVRGGLFGSIESDETFTVTIDNSTDIDIFGSPSEDEPLTATITNSSDIEIFGAMGESDLTIASGSDIDIFGVRQGRVAIGSLDEQSVSHLRLHISDFGAIDDQLELSITVDNSIDIGIFGSESDEAASLDLTITNSVDIGIFGSAEQSADIEIAASQDIDIFGIASGSIRLGPANGAGQGVTRATIEVARFGSMEADGETLSITIENSSDIDIFGSPSSDAAMLDATVTNSSDIDIFGSLQEGGELIVVASEDVSIFAQASSRVQMTGVTGGAIFTELFGGDDSLMPIEVSVLDNSSDIGIFGSPDRNADIEIVASSDVDIFGGTAQTTIGQVTYFGDTVILNNVRASTVASGVFGSLDVSETLMTVSVINNSSDIDIFGSDIGSTEITIVASEDIDIFNGFGDVVNLQNASRIRIEGGVFGSPEVGEDGLTISVQGNSSDIAIFGSPVSDQVTLSGGTHLRTNLRGGDDRLDISAVIDFVAVTDAGDDAAIVRSGDDILVYLAAGRDRAQVLGGTNVRIIGAEEDDELFVSGGEGIDIDGGSGNDTSVVVGGFNVNLRSDGGDDRVKYFGGSGQGFGNANNSSGSLISGGSGNDVMQLYGNFGTALSVGSVYAVVDGQSGDDWLEVLPLLNLESRQTGATDPLEGIPIWMPIIGAIASPLFNTAPSSIALVGGVGNDRLRMQGNQRLVALGGDGDDDISLIAGNNSIVAGGDGSDTIAIDGSGVDNYVFGDAGDDTVYVRSGIRISVMTEEGDDRLEFSGSQQSIARSGSGDDSVRVTDGFDLILSAERGIDTLSIEGGRNILAAGGPGQDRLDVHLGISVILLGESGNDELTLYGGTNAILSGGDGDDRLVSGNRSGDLYGDDGDDNYEIKQWDSQVNALENNERRLRIRELQFIDSTNFEAEARGSDTIDLSAMTLGVVLDLGRVDIDQAIFADQLLFHLNGSFENVIGTSHDDELIGTAQSNRIDGGAGNDVLRGLGGDDELLAGVGNDLLVGGNGDDRYVFASSGESLGSDRIVEDIGGGIDVLDFSGLPSALGTLDLQNSLVQSLAGSLIALTLTRDVNGQAVAEMEEVVGTIGNDRVLGNDLDNRFELLGGDDEVSGRAGSDIYIFSGYSLGRDTIIESPTDPGRDTLDFTAFSAALAPLDLAQTHAQNFATELTLMLSSASGIENVVGTSFDDTILGNDRNNSLFGAAGRDRLEGRGGDDRLVADLPAVVLLDFDSAFIATRGDYDYTAAERAAIQARIEADYAAFNWIFTQSEATARELTADIGRSFVRLAFSEGRGGSVSGDAGEVDFRNINRRLVSQVNINSLKSIVLESIGPLNSPQQFDRYSDAIVGLTATIASHELAHTAGLRHGDAFGPIGFGIFSDTDSSRIFPAYSGTRDAVETPHHIIASPASVGTSIADAFQDTFFGAREALKLAFDEIGHTIREQSTSSTDSFANAEDLGSLTQLYVPNLAPVSGFHYSGKLFDVSALAVVGELTHGSDINSTEVDYYRFTGRRGELVNIELLANSVRPLRGTGFDGRLRIFLGVDGTLLADNDDDFEGTLDATLQDVVLPADGEYVIAVSLSTQPATVERGGRYELFVSRFRALDAGGATLPSAPGDILIGGPGADRMQGASADDLLSAVDSVFGDLADEVSGGAGFDVLDLEGRAYEYRLAQNHSIERIINANLAPVASLAVTPSLNLDEGNAVTVSLIAASDSSAEDTAAGFRYAFILKSAGGNIISGTEPTSFATAQFSNTATFTLPDSGTYTVTGRIFDHRNGFRDYTAEIHAANLAPTGTLYGPSSVALGQSAIYSVTAQDASTLDADALRYSFAKDLSGLANSYATASPSNSSPISFAVAGAQALYARVWDKDGDSVTLTMNVSVINEVGFTLTAPVGSAVGQTIDLRLSGSGLPAGATYLIHWGDGASQTIAAPGGLTTVAHQYTQLSNDSGYVITVVAKNSSGVVLATHSSSIAVTSMLVVTEGSRFVLYAGATEGNDAVTVRRIDSTTLGIKLSASGIETVYRYGAGPTPLSRITLFGLNGHDTLTIGTDLPVDAELFGGAGNDILRGGAGNDLIVGGDGNDQLYGNGGSDLMIGGSGRDSIFSDGNQDILISGWTNYDSNRTALSAILNYWTSNPSDASLLWYQARVNTLQSSGVGSGVVLNNGNVFDDNTLDSLSGEVNAGGNPARKPNWYIYNTAGSGVRDSLQRKIADEIVTDIGDS